MYKYRISDFGRMFLYNAESDEEGFEGRKSHCHKEFEIYYMIDGEVEIILEGKKFFIVADSLLLIPSNCFHQWEYPPGRIHRRISVHFLPEFLDKTERNLFLDKFNEPVHFLNGSFHKLNFFIQTIAECELFDESMQKAAAKLRLASLLAQIQFLRSSSSVKPVILDERIRQVIVYIGRHLKDDLSLDILADRFTLHKNHLNVLFHRIVGIPIMKYVSAKRLGMAQQEILSGARLNEAAYSAGFKDYTTFFRAYRSFYGCSPSEALNGNSVKF